MGALVLASRMGIIPAYAGNTDKLFDRFDIGGDHPRVCGEHTPPSSFHP